MAGIATGGGPLDRVDRPRGRQERLDRRVLGQQARPDVAARIETRGARRARPRQLEPMVELGMPIRAIADAARRELLDRAALAEAPRPDHATRASTRRDGRGAGGRRRHRARAPARSTDRHVRPSRATTGFAASRAEPKPSTAGGAGSRRSWSRRQAALACSAATRRTLAALHFHHVDPAREVVRPRRSRRDALAWTPPAPRPRSASCSARTVMPRSSWESSGYPVGR